MEGWIVLIAVIIIIIALRKRKKRRKALAKAEAEAKSQAKQSIEPPNIQNVNAPNPETANPKEVIDFISDCPPDVIKQVYHQLLAKNIKIPGDLDKLFQEKITNLYLFKERYYWKTSIESYQIEKEKLNNYKENYSFELQGVHVPANRKRLENCIIFEKVILKKQPRNKYDSNAIQVIANSGALGHVPADETEIVHKIIDQEHKAFIEKIFLLGDHLRVTIKIYHNNNEPANEPK